MGSLMEIQSGMPLRAMHVSPCPFPHFACRFSLVKDPSNLTLVSEQASEKNDANFDEELCI